MPIRSFRNQGTQDIAQGMNSKAARAVLPPALHSLAYHRLLRIDAAILFSDLALYPSHRLEKLRGDRAGQHSVRINEKYRICFQWKNGDAFEVEIVDYH